MIATCVHVQVKPEFVDAFIKETRINHEHSVQEDGNFRFDVLQQIDNPTIFILYEAYQNEEFALAHKETKHYKEWRDSVAHMMATDRKGIKHQIIFPNASIK